MFPLVVVVFISLACVSKSPVSCAVEAINAPDDATFVASVTSALASIPASLEASTDG